MIQWLCHQEHRERKNVFTLDCALWADALLEGIAEKKEGARGELRGVLGNARSREELCRLWLIRLRSGFYR